MKPLPLTSRCFAASARQQRWCFSLFLCGLFSGSRALRRTSAWVAAIAFVINAHFYVLVGPERKDFRIGYFLWWFAFLLLAIGLFALSPRGARKFESRNESTASA
jgi:hypothetical protein